MPAMSAAQTLRLVRASLRAVYPGRGVEIRIATTASGRTTCNTYLWDGDIEIVDYLHRKDLTEAEAGLFELDEQGRLGLDLIGYNAQGDWISDKGVYVQAGPPCAIFLDSAMTRSVKEFSAPRPRKDALTRLGKDMVEACEEEVRKTVRTLLEHPMLAQSGIRIHSGAEPQITFSWSLKRRRSRAGAKGLSLAMCAALYRAKGGVFREYARFSADPVIGSKPVQSVHEWLRLLTAHELAHWLQYSPQVSVPASFGLLRAASHGEGFRAIYRVLRRALSESQAQQPTRSGESSAT